MALPFLLKRRAPDSNVPAPLAAAPGSHSAGRPSAHGSQWPQAGTKVVTLGFDQTSLSLGGASAGVSFTGASGAFEISPQGIAGQLSGYPNGRRLEDDVVDIDLRAIACGYGPVLHSLLGLCDFSPNDLRNASDVCCNDRSATHRGFDQRHRHALIVGREYHDVRSGVHGRHIATPAEPSDSVAELPCSTA